MNKTYKTVWNQSLGEWVATSELAKGHVKSSSTVSKTAFALALTICGANAFALNINGGAAGSPVAGGSYTTDSAYNVSGYFNTGLSTGNPAGSNVTTYDNFNSSVNLGSTFSTLAVSGATGAHAVFTGNNSLTLGTNGDTALILSTSGGSGDAKITVSGNLNINNQANWRDSELDGLEANAGANGDSIITHTGTGTITTNGGHAIQARTSGNGDNDVEVTLDSTAGKNQIHLVTHGTSITNSAIGAKGSSATGKVTVNSNAKITTTGGTAHGIYATSAGKAADGKTVDVINSGTIAASGLGSSVITAVATTSSANGTVSIANTGSVNSDRHGLHALGFGGDVSINNTGTLTTTNQDGAGIRAEQNINSTTGNITVTTEASSVIVTNGVQAEGIHAYLGQEDSSSGNRGAASSGNITVDAKGSITTKGNGSAEGIFAGITNSNATGDINVTFEGTSIETTGAGGNRGILVRQMGSGNVTVNHLSGKIKTAGNDSYGISIGAGLTGTDGGKAASMGEIKVTSRAQIETSGNNAHGIQADIQNTTTGFTIDSFDSIKTTGTSSSAIHITANHSAANTGKITVNQTGGRFDTDGVSAHGIYVFTNAKQGDIEVNLTDTVMSLNGTNSDGIGVFQTNANLLERTETNITINTSGGSITTLDNPTGGGLANYGIVVFQDGNADGNITINNAGTNITTKLGTDGLGGFSDAIYGTFRNNAAGATGDIVITNTGNLSTQGISASGIKAANNGSGKVSIEHNAAITTAGNQSSAILTAATSGATLINVGADSVIKTSGTDAHGIYATGTGGGLISIYNAGKISTLDAVSTSAKSHAIFAEQKSTSASEGIEIMVEDAQLNTSNSDASGVRAHTSASSGDIDIIVQGSEINVDGINADGILAQKNVLLATDASNVNINITSINNQINVLQNPTQTGNGNMNFGIAGVQAGAAAGDINIINSNTDISVGNGSTGVTNTSGAIYARFTGADATGNIDIKNDSTLTSTSNSNNTTGVITAQNSGSGDVNIYNIGNIVSEGDGSYGIKGSATNGGSVNITSHADISLNAISHASTVKGIAALADKTGNATVTATGNISVLGAPAGASVPSAIEARSREGDSIINFSNGVAQSHGSTFVAWDYASGLGQKGLINLTSNAVVRSTNGFAVTAFVTGGNTVNIDETSRIEGKQGINIQSNGATTENQINNWGVIDVGDDIAIQDTSLNGAVTTINNWGTIVGQFSFATDAIVVVNNYSQNSINMRNFTDADGDGTRETHGVAVLDYGLGGWTATNNDVNGTVRLALITNETSINTTGEYVPAGALSISNLGIAQGQMLNLDEFVNSGLIELSTNKLAGDVLVITGSDTAGTLGTGTYVSNSGTLSVDTIINEGGIISQSDILVVDNVKLGTGATRIVVNPAENGTGGLTLDDGIKIVEVLGTQESGAFELAAPVSYGAYEYVLRQGTGANANNWFLRNNNNGQVFYSPTVGAYLGNQYAASTMFNHNILDRRDNVASPDQTVWGRINYSDLKTDILDGSGDASIDSYVMQLGADLLKHNDWVAGAYVGYGHSSVDNKSTITNTQANGKVKGYQLGVYGSWMPQENKGPYVDLWGHVARYNNDLSGATEKGDYNSTGYALSVEGGYAFEFNTTADGKAWIVKPHAQIIYNYLNSDDFSINNTLYHDSDSSGIQTRLGARLYMQKAGGSDGIVPFVELNWLGNYTNNKVEANNDQASTDIGKNVGELKLGAQGKINEGFSVWGHVGGQAGSESYKRYEAQVGLGYEW